MKRSDFKENKELTGGTPEYGLSLETDGNVYHFNVCIADGDLELVGYGDKLWWIGSAELLDFIREATSVQATDAWFVSEAWPMAEKYAVENGLSITKDNYTVFRYTDEKSVDVVFPENDGASSVQVTFTRGEDGTWAVIPVNAVNLVDRDRWTFEVSVSDEIANNIPAAVIDFAQDYVAQEVDSWNNGNLEDGIAVQHINKVIEAKITGITQINTGTAALDYSINMYLLEYRLLPEDQDNIVLVGGMQAEMIDGRSWLTEWGSTGQPHLLLLAEDDNWTRICVTNTDSIDFDYGTPEMLEQYGDKYTAAAMELYKNAATLDRIATLTESDVKYITSTFNHITELQLVAALNGASEHLTYEQEGISSFYSLTVYLSGGPGSYSSDDEHLILYAGLDEGIVQMFYSDGSGNSSEHYFDDSTLYWLLRDNYHTDETIDAERYSHYQDIIEDRAQKMVDEAVGMAGAKPFSGYEVISFTHIDTFEADDARYDVYSWDVAFTTDDPQKVIWAGGMYLDSEARVRAYDGYTYFVIKTVASEEEHRFLFWDLYLGPDEAAGWENAWTKIDQAFGVEEQVDAVVTANYASD